MPPRTHDEQTGARVKLVAGILTASFGLLALVAAAGAFLYWSDYKVDATVQETNCSLFEVTVKTKQFGIEHTVTDVPLRECLLLQPGSFVEYRIRTQHTTLYLSEGGDCIYDSRTGPC